jgi:hypothetical protein
MPGMAAFELEKTRISERNAGLLRVSQAAGRFLF